MNHRRDETVEEYLGEIARITRLVSKYRGIRRRASRPGTIHRLNRTLYTLYVGRGQLRRVVDYLQSRERFITDIPTLHRV